MLIQTAERKHLREVHEQDPTAWWPRNATDLWWRACKRTNESPDRVALRQLDAWKYRLNYGHHLLIPAFQHHLQVTGAAGAALALDNISVAALGAYSFARKLRRDYSGAAYRVVRASNGDPLEVGFSDTAVNNAACATHCSGTSGKSVILYDQGPRAAHLDVPGQGIAGNEPTIYQSGALCAMPNGVVAGLTPGGSAHGLSSQLGAYGVSGNPALTIAWAANRISGENRCWEYGGTSTSEGLICDLEVSRGIFLALRPGSANKQFTYDSTANTPQSFILKKAASTALSGFDIEVGGSNLSTLALNSGGTTPALADQRLVLWNWRGANDSIYGHIAAFIWFASVLTGTDLTALRTEMAHYA